MRRRRWRRRFAGSAGPLVLALAVFYILSLAGVWLAWWDAEIRPPGLADGVVGYVVCVGLLAPAFVLRGRWRSVPTLLAAAAGVVLPVYLASDLLSMLGIRDVWIGQSLTLGVLFPLLVGGLALLAQLVGPGRGPAGDDPRSIDPHRIDRQG